MLALKRVTFESRYEPKMHYSWPGELDQTSISPPATPESMTTPQTTIEIADISGDNDSTTGDSSPLVSTDEHANKAACYILPAGTLPGINSSNQRRNSHGDITATIPLLPQRSSDDSGLEIGGSPACPQRRNHQMEPSSPKPLDRASSYGGSMCSLPHTGSMSRSHYRRRNNDLDSFVIVLSALYAKLLVVMGLCFPMAEVISKRIPISFYEGFYLYLYGGSIVFLMYVYLFLLRQQKSQKSTDTCTMFCRFKYMTRSGKMAPHVHPDGTEKRPVVDDNVTHAGSFYLRLGAVAFGTGSMIYSGLEFGQFFEVEPDSQCYNILFSLTPATRMAFTFFQLYFIFINSRVAINKYTTLARFGLMHMISTNLCVWLHVLIQETKHQILELMNDHNKTHVYVPFAHNGFANINPDPEHAPFVNPVHYETRTDDHHRLERRSLDHSFIEGNLNCRRANIMGELVQNASPFLFPCTIEYSLICAGVLYIIWKNVGATRHLQHQHSRDSSSAVQGKTRHYYQVDCAKANKGLFTGILVLVLSIISLILFFVLINKPQYRKLAVLEAHIAELGVYILASFATAIAMFQIRELNYNRHRNLDLESILLIVAQSGLYLYNMFSIIGGHFTVGQNTMLTLLTALACLIQGSLQTIFILDASRRYVSNSDQAERKPGREMVTFLIVCNFSMWAINTLETRRADSNPVQMGFYGFWAWTIITHVTAPLTIFFRFHSTVCLCDIWKRAYKTKQEYV